MFSLITDSFVAGSNRESVQSEVGLHSECGASQTSDRRESGEETREVKWTALSPK